MPGDIRSRNHKTKNGMFELEFPSIAIRDLDPRSRFSKQRLPSHAYAYASKYARNQGAVKKKLLRLSTKNDGQKGDFARLALDHYYLRGESSVFLVILAKRNVTILSDRWRHGRENGQKVSYVFKCINTILVHQRPSIPETISKNHRRFRYACQ